MHVFSVFTIGKIVNKNVESQRCALDPWDFALILIRTAVSWLAVPAPCVVQPVPGFIKLGFYSVS